MAYQEVLAPASPAAIIDSIRSFAAGVGFTVERNTLVGSNRTLTLKRPETDYIHIYNLDATNIYIRCSIDYDSGTSPDTTTRRSSYQGINVNAGPYTKLFLFGGTAPTAHVHVVIETAIAGIYRHLSFGMIEKIEEFTGGTYMGGSNWFNDGSNPAVSYNTQNHAMFGRDVDYFFGDKADALRCDFAADARVDTWFKNGYSGGTGDPHFWAALSTGADWLTWLTQYCDDNPFSNRSVFHLFDVMVNRVGGYWSRVGTYPNVRICNMKKYTPAQEITIGSDTWKVFPFARKWSPQLNLNAPVYNVNSDYFGYAFKKVA